MLQLRHRALYASFDRFPSRKGAAIHIDRVARTLFDATGGGLLFVVGDESLPFYQHEDRIEIVRCVAESANFLERTIEFGRQLGRLAARQRDSLTICHFRDPWSGVPVLHNRERGCTAIYEINGLPSIELPYRYPGLSDATIRKIREAEQFCWETADFIITPSNSMKKNLIGLGAAEEKISVISNGADIARRPDRPEGAPPRYIIYFGALQRWQGVDTLLRAMKRLSDFEDLRLIVCVSTHQHSAKPYRKLSEKLGVADRIDWFFGLNEGELAPWRANALLSVAPLAECARNLDQGCCPLKILESMADGVPVVASDLPSTREIIADRVDGFLVRPDRPSELAMAIRVLLEYPDRLRLMGDAARRKIERDFTWDSSLARLDSFYRSVIDGSSSEQRPDSENAQSGLATGSRAIADRML